MFIRSNQCWRCFLIRILGTLIILSGSSAMSQTLKTKIHQIADQIESEVIEWRRDFHQNPELSNREFRTAGVVAEFLKSLDMEVQTEVGKTGVVGLLKGKSDTPVVALRADMDALPVTEALNHPFSSKARATYNGQEVGVMHACGHDAHMAICMGAAKVLAKLRDELPGTVKFIFQPAEEGAPAGERGGASFMIEQGVLENPAPGAIFGLHVFPFEHGLLAYRAGPTMASVDGLRITVHGKQTHGAVPWGGIDPVVVASQIVLGLQTIVSRQLNITEAPAVISIGSIHGGVRSNIIPDKVEMVGTIRSFGPERRKDIHQRIKTTVLNIVESAGAKVDIEIDLGNPAVMNDEALVKLMAPSFERAAGQAGVKIVPPLTIAEDFSRFQQKIPGIYFFLGIVPEGSDPLEAPMNHSPYFDVDEKTLIVGVRALANLAADYLYLKSEQ